MITAVNELKAYSLPLFGWKKIKVNLGNYYIIIVIVSVLFYL